MKRFAVLFLILVFIASLGIAAIAKHQPPPDLEIQKVHWIYTRSSDTPGSGWDYIAGVLKNNSNTKYDSVTITVSIIDRDSGDKIATMTSRIASVMPGDKCEWNAGPALCLSYQDTRRNRYEGRVDSVEGIPAKS